MKNLKDANWGYTMQPNEIFSNYPSTRSFAPAWNNNYAFFISECYNSYNTGQKTNSRIIPQKIYGIKGEPFGKIES